MADDSQAQLGHTTDPQQMRNSDGEPHWPWVPGLIGLIAVLEAGGISVSPYLLVTTYGYFLGVDFVSWTFLVSPGYA